jgi:hypothetical protein
MLPSPCQASSVAKLNRSKHLELYWTMISLQNICTESVEYMRFILSWKWKKITPWPDPASEIYLPIDRRFSTKLVPTSADIGSNVLSAIDPYGSILGFLDRRRYFYFQVAPQLHSRGWVYSVQDSLLFRKSGSSGNRIRDLWICSQELWPLDHRGGLLSST